MLKCRDVEWTMDSPQEGRQFISGMEFVRFERSVRFVGSRVRTCMRALDLSTYVRRNSGSGRGGRKNQSQALPNGHNTQTTREHSPLLGKTALTGLGWIGQRFLCSNSSVAKRTHAWPPPRRHYNPVRQYGIPLHLNTGAKWEYPGLEMEHPVAGAEATQGPPARKFLPRTANYGSHLRSCSSFRCGCWKPMWRGSRG